MSMNSNERPVDGGTATAPTPEKNAAEQSMASQVLTLKTAGAANFSSIEQVEKAEIALVRIKKAGKLPKQLPNPTGLAFSGGGIRSATFNLGVLQALHELNMLIWFDYLSTVSGGGYIGSWLVSNIKSRRKTGGIADYDTIFASQGQALVHLRRYSRYLAPESGFFSADTWTIFTIWIRNTFLIQASVLPVIALALLAPRAIPIVFNLVQENDAYGWPGVLAAGFLWLGVWNALKQLRAISKDVTPADPNIEAKPDPNERLSPQAKTQWKVVIPLMLAATLTAAAMWPMALRHDSASRIFAQTLDDLSRLFKQPALASHPIQYLASNWPVFFKLIWEIVSILIPFLSFAALAGILTRGSNREKLSPLRQILIIALCGTLGLLLVTPLTGWAGYLDAVMKYGPRPWWPVVGPAAVMFSFSLVVVLHIGLVGRNMGDHVREWWGRLGAWIFIYSFAILVMTFVSLESPGLWAMYSPLHLNWLSGSAVLTWLGSTLASVLGGRSSKTSGEESKGNGSAVMETVLKFAPYVALLGLFLAVAAADEKLIATIALLWNLQEACAAGILFLAISILGFLFWWSFDLNECSLNHFYRNRLARCYLGAARDTRKPDGFTNFDFADDFKLSSLRHYKTPDPNKDSQPLTALDSECSYDGPYLIVNTALNTSHGGDLSIQDRKAESFVFTPHYTGVQKPPGAHPEDGRPEGYQPTDLYMSGDGVGSTSVGKAIAISGAAASPNWGYHTSPVIAFLLTLFNVRLGWWVPNPALEGWDKPCGGLQLMYLLQELFGSTTPADKHLYLSDGGHFDNLGLYELVRRKCKFIVIGDGEEDHLIQCESLAGAIRKCWIDLQTRIVIDVSQIQKRDAGKNSQRHCAVGRIIYPDKQEGVLIYLKSSVTGDEDTDIAQYRMVHPEFPHESTLNQFFTEDQFESYRRLGYHVTLKAMSGPDGPLPGGPPGPNIDWDAFMSALRERWPIAKEPAPDRPDLGDLM